MRSTKKTESKARGELAEHVTMAGREKVGEVVEEFCSGFSWLPTEPLLEFINPHSHLMSWHYHPLFTNEGADLLRGNLLKIHSR